MGIPVKMHVDVTVITIVRTLSTYKMDTAIRVQILYEAVWISHSV